MPIEYDKESEELLDLIQWMGENDLFVSPVRMPNGAYHMIIVRSTGKDLGFSNSLIGALRMAKRSIEEGSYGE